MEGKNWVIAGVLVVAIVVAGIYAAKRMDIIGGGAQPPDSVMKQPITLIDMNKPYTLVTKSLGDWEKLGQDEAKHYKNPETKEFTMATPMLCAHCKKQTPPPPYTAAMQKMDAPAREAEMLKIDQDYKCPLCGQSPFPPDYLKRRIPPTAK